MRGGQDDEPRRTDDDRDAVPVAPRHHRLAATTSLRDRPLVPCRPSTLVVRGRATRLQVKP